MSVVSAPRSRWLESFASIDGQTIYTFPRYQFEEDHAQALRTAYSAVVGADYPYDMQGTLSSPKESGAITVRFALYESDPRLLNADRDSVRATLYRIGQGRLWSNDGTTRRWCKARLRAMPSINIQQQHIFFLPVVVQFDRLSDWYDATPQVQTTAITLALQQFNLTNPGALPALTAQFTFRARSATGMKNPQLTNLTTGESFSLTYTSSSANSQARVDAGTYGVTTSENNGASWSNAYANLSLGPLQVGYMQLVPGTNTMQYVDGAAPNLFLDASFYPAY